MAREVVIVPHTHWDREWYAPFQTFRLRLVELLDQLLDLLDGDPGYAHFMLDGQMAVVDDYLAMRPHERDRLRRLAGTGRLGVGPWYILMDEFLVSGETIIRDLLLGLDRAAELGGASTVGYLPDMFGHIAQMPQLLRRAGFDHAVVWRGVPAAVDRTGFWWQAPDGSTVRAQYLPDGYGNGASLPADAKDLVVAIDRFAAQHGDLLTGPILWLNGTDHLLPQPWLGRVVAEANAIQDDYHLRVGSLASALAGSPTEGLATWTGELRSGSRANLLMGVASNRTDVKQAAATAERWIERCAEPLSALFLPPDEWPAPFLAEAWAAIIRNSAHDSSCACSHDDVCAAVLVRYQEARHIGEGLAERVVSRLAGLVDRIGPVVVNPAGRIRSGAVAISAPGHEPAPGTQLLRRGGGDEVTDGLTTADAALRVQTVLDARPDLGGAEVALGPDGVLDIRLCHDPDTPGPRYDGSVLAEVRIAAAADPGAPARLTLTTPPVHDALVPVAGVPGFGWAPVEPAGTAAVVVTDRAVTNGLVMLTVADDGTFSLAGRRSVTGLGRLVDDGDSGDTYNYNPPAHDAVVDTPDEVTVRVLEDGPVRARLAIDRRYTWPVEVDDAEDRRVGSVAVHTTTVVEVVAGSPLVRVTTEVDNPCRDHRLRVWFPLPEAAEGSRAECAFAVVDRGLTAEGGPTERPLPTYPSRRFVIAGGLTVVHDGLPEYELVDVREDGAHTLALTLLRCTGTISRGPMAYRPLPAGPPTLTPAAQLPGRHVLRYGVQLGDDPAAAYAAVDDAFLPLFVARAAGGGPGPDRGSALDIAGAEVSAVLRDAGGQLVVRLFNPTDRPVTARLPGRHGWRTDLRGRAEEPFEQSVALDPWEIATLTVLGG